jgi:hypothetical protein
MTVRRTSTIADLKRFSISSAEGGSRNVITCDILFATGERNKRGLVPYRDLKKLFNGIFIRRGKPEDFAGTNRKIGFLMVRE